MFTHPSSRAQGATVPGFYHYHYGDVFLPGSQNVVFQPAFTLPMIQLIGAAIYAGPAPNPRQRSPQIFVTQAAPIAGLGGMISGQFVTQPLNIPDTTNGSQ